MTPPTVEACCVRMSAEALVFLAELRIRTDVRPLMDGATAWLFFRAGDREVLHRLLAADGAQFFERRGGQWYEPGRHLPSFEVPDSADARPLIALLTPAPISPETPPATRAAPLRLRLVRDGRPRPARALCCWLADLAAWADHATSHQFAGLQAAVDAEARVLVVGEHLPPLAVGDRYWGKTVLVPLGWRPEPDLGEEALREVCGLGCAALGLLTADGVEVVDRNALRPLTRGGVRLAVQRPRA
jgi:hypothetical protein